MGAERVETVLMPFISELLKKDCVGEFRSNVIPLVENYYSKEESKN